MDEFSLLCRHYGSDKVDHHDFSPIYYQYLSQIKLNELILLEIGTGGYWHRDQGGAATKAFRDFLPNSKIITVDIYDKPILIGEKRINFYKGSQIDEDLLRKILMIEGNPDIIIDDGSHINPMTLQTFAILYPHLKSGGFYFVEDIHTSYWEQVATDGTDFGGGTHNATVMNYFKSMTDSLNHGHSIIEDMGIKSISFYRELIVIQKK